MSVNSDTKQTSEKLEASSPEISLETMQHENCSKNSTEDVPSTGQVVCGIPDCEQQGANLSFPAIHVQMYYGLIGMDIGQVCSSCVSKADEFRQHDDKLNARLFIKRSEIIRNGGSLDELTHEPELETLPNNHQQDSEDKSEADHEEMDVDVVAVVDGILKKLTQFVQKTEADIVQLEGDFKQMDGEYGRIRGVADKAMQKLSNHFNPQPEIIVTHEVDIPADGPISHRMLPSESPDETDTQMQVVTVQQLILPCSSTLKRKWNQSPTPSPTPKALTSNGTHEICFPIVGDVVYALNTNLESCWLMATVLEPIENAEINEVEFLVEFEPTNRTSGKPVKPRCVMKAGALRLKRQLTTKQMAHSIQVPATHPVGTRVVADLRDELEIDPEDDGEFYVGVVGEIPKPSTKNRYLIFFDNGRTKYVTSERVFLVYSSSTEVWNDVLPDSADFIQSYLSNFPKFGVARVLEVDCSLAKLHVRWMRTRPSGFTGTRDEFTQYTKAIIIMMIQIISWSTRVISGNLKYPTTSLSQKSMRLTSATLCALYTFQLPCLTNKPLAIPLFLGWTRNSRRAIFYIAPCGRKLANYSEVNDYLETTETNMPIDFFCFDNDLDNFAEGKEARPIQLVNSIDQDSLPCFEYIADSVGSPDVELKMMLTYGKYSMSCACIELQGMKADIYISFEKLLIKFGKSSCSCWNATTAGKPSGTLTPAKAYGNRRLQQAIIGGVYECSSVSFYVEITLFYKLQLLMQTTCHNRVVQCGMTWPLQIFNTAKKGWALRAYMIYPKALLFANKEADEVNLSEYFGALSISKTHGGFYMAALNHEEEDEKKKPSDRKMMKLEPIDVPFLVKGIPTLWMVERRGMWGGLLTLSIKHSCDPNLFMQNVFIDSHDPRFPHLAFFTACLVKAGSELVFDYNLNKDPVPEQR
ncbi:Histone-lysine N-methyltransferase eggless, partial [Orchesella cincta]